MNKEPDELLPDEPPKDPRKLVHSFSHSDAVKYGLGKAIVLRTIFLETQSVQYDPVKGVPYSAKRMARGCPYLNHNTVAGYISDLCRMDVLINTPAPREGERGYDPMDSMNRYRLSRSYEHNQYDTVRFRVRDAYNCGLKSAIIINKLRGWIDYHKGEGRYEFDYMYWAFMTRGALNKRFPYIGTMWTIGGILKQLESSGIIKSRKGVDPTNPDKKWYTIPREFFGENIPENWGCTPYLKSYPPLVKIATPPSQNRTLYKSIKKESKQSISELPFGNTREAENNQEDKEMGLRKAEYSNPVSGIKQVCKPVIVPQTDTAQEAYENSETIRLSREVARMQANRHRVPSTSEVSCMWCQMVADHHPELPEQKLTTKQACILRNYALSYCRQGKRHSGVGEIPFENFSKYMELIIQNWQAMVVNTLFWMKDKPSNEPSVTLFCTVMLREKFEAFAANIQQGREYAGLTQREAYHLKHIHAGKTEAEAKRLTDRKFGTEEAVSEERILKLMNKMLQDLNYTIREDERIRKTRESKASLDKLVAEHRKQYGKLSVEDQLEQINQLAARPFQESEEIA